MNFISPQIAAFIAVIEERSFEGAARRLSVTSSAISQRVRTLEERLGQLLVVRQSPCRVTPAGQQLLSRVKPMLLLEAEAIADFLPEETDSAISKNLSIAVNEDSLSTWLLEALGQLHSEHGYIFDLSVDDQDYTLNHLRDGTAIGAITSESTPLQGCIVHLLGNIRYCAIASPQFAQQYFPHGLTADAFNQAPMVAYNRKDLLQSKFMSAVTHTEIFPGSVHYLPNAVGFVEAASRHMGWCVADEGVISPAIESGAIVNLAPDIWLEEPLYWQHASIRSQILTNITQAFFRVTKKALHQDKP